MRTLPVIALRGMSVLPGMLVHFDINRETTIGAVEAAISGDQYIFVTSQKSPDIDEPTFFDLFDVGVVAKVKQIVKLNDGIARVMISTKERGTMMTMTQTKPYFIGDILPCEEIPEIEEMDEKEIQAKIRNIKEYYQKYLIENPRVGKSAYDKIKQEENLGRLLDLVGMNMMISAGERQELLECFSIPARYDIVVNMLANEVEISKIQTSFQQRVKEEIGKNQKEYYLREQMKVIRKELGDTSEEEDADKYLEKLNELECSQEVREKVEEEVRRLRTIPGNSSEYVVARGYIETLLGLPWDKMREDNNDLQNAEVILNEDHYGLIKVKERILEFLAVRALTGKGESPIICLVGPPGTGKTSIAKSIARSLEKRYIRICLGGMRDEAEIRGHRRTYVGAMPGRLIDGLKKAKVKNPLILLDEIDKVSSDYKGDTSSALLEVLDPEQNKNFVDHYVELPVDLSEVLFLCTANSIDTIPRPLLDRMELIEVSGYTANEKMHIAKDYLLPKQLDKHGLMKKQLNISEKSMGDIIGSYTKEAGVRSLERQIGKICRKTAKKIIDDPETKVRISAKNLEDYLGRKKYTTNMANRVNEVGIVRGLAWTKVGGDTLEVEVNIMNGKGKMELTGQLGDVMKESARIALSYIRSLEKKHKKDGKYFVEHDFHLHVPAGAVPKDGPSAGITMATALYSAITGIPVLANAAMTGEITLRGRVLPIGGLKEKLLAAKVAGIKRVLVPEKNRPDVAELEKEVTSGLEILFVSKMEEVLKWSLSQ